MDQDVEVSEQHRIPAIERMMAVLEAVEASPDGIRLGALIERTRITRSTLYRILNSLLAHGLVREIDSATYVLGSRFLKFAEGVTGSPENQDIVQAAKLHLDALVQTLGESVKLSVYDRGVVLVVSAISGTMPYALHARVGQTLPIHAGAGSKVLLASRPEAEIAAILSRKLPALTNRTLIDPVALEKELDLVKAQGWARDHGEFTVSINAIAAPVLNQKGQTVAALSVPFLAGRDAAYEETIRNAVLATAVAIGADLR